MPEHIHACRSKRLTDDDGRYIVFVCDQCGVVSEGKTQNDALPEAIKHAVSNQFEVR